MTSRLLPFTCAVCVLAACAGALLADDLPSAGVGGKADVPLDRVPQAVLDAAAAKFPGIALVEAKLRSKKSGVVFKLTGATAGREYRLKVDAAGNVLDVKEGHGKKGDAAGAIPVVNNSPARPVGVIAHPPVRESSGVAASRTHPGVLWTHNDKGNAPALYAITRSGELLAEYAVFAPADDWEDVAVDDAGNLYVGNIGNNKAGRDSIEVYRVAEPDPAGQSHPAALKVDRVWRLRFPAEPFDCEALFVHGGHGYVISKLFTGDPAAVYRFPLDGNSESTTVLEKVTELPVRDPVTAADLSPDGKRLAVLSAGGLHVFAVDGDVARAGSAEADTTPVPPGKLEGVCFTPEGIVLTSEGRDVFLVPARSSH